MIKNFLASAVGLRKETATLDVSTYATDNVIKEGLVVKLNDDRFGIVIDEKDVTDKETVVVGVVTAGHVIDERIDLTKVESVYFNQETIKQGLYVENYKEAQYPADDNGEMEEYVVE